MSTYSSFAGISLKLNEDKKDLNSLIKILEIIGVENANTIKDIDDLHDKLYSPKLKKWSLYYDIDGNYGLIYLTENENEAFDIEYNLSLDDFNDIIGELNPNIREYFISREPKDAKSFAHIYYNGSDNPFKF